MRPTSVWMVSMDQDDAFRGQHLLQLGTRAGYSTVVSRVSCSRVVCCAARLEGTDSFTTDLFHPMILEGVFRLLNLGKTEAAAREQSRRRQEATKRGSSTTSDKPTIQQQVQRRVRKTLLPGGPMQRNESRSLVRGRPRRPRTGLSDQQ